MGGQLDGNFLPGSLSHKFILLVTLIICFVVNNFFSLSLFPGIFFFGGGTLVPCSSCRCRP